MNSNYKWYRDDYENELRYGYLRQKRKNSSGRRILVYIALVLVTSLLTGTAVSSIMYRKFSNELARIELLAKETKQTDTAYNHQSGDGFLQETQSNANSESRLANAVVAGTDAKDYPVSVIAREVGPSIVGIRMITESPLIGFFGTTTEQSTEEGSGIIISSDGYIMTNYHVVQYADPKKSFSKNTVLEVFLPDKRQAKAKFVGGDAKNDLAVIKIDLKDLPAAKLGDSSKLQVGEPVVAIGNPLGLEFAGSVTAGVVSALNRKVETDDKVLNLIQTDAAINPGNSGGALVNYQGEIIGINTIKISVTGVEGLGFAIPINDAKPIVNELIKYGYVKGRPAIGISVREITEVLSQWYNIPMGLLVLETTPGGAADNAGIKRGDIIINVAGKRVKTMKELEQVKQGYRSGDSVDVTVVRDGKKLTVKLTFAEER